MKHLIPSFALAALVSTAAQAATVDGNQTTNNSADKVQMMKDCMDRQKAMNTGMTQAAMETVCKNEAKGNGAKDGNDLATGPKHDPDTADK